MPNYREEKIDVLSKNKIRAFKNTVEKPCVMAQSHWHDLYEILFIKEGYGEQQINSRKFNFTPDTCIVIRPGDIHSTVATSQNGCDIEVLQFIPEYLGEREHLLSGLPSSVIEAETEEIASLLDCVKRYADSEGADGELILSGAMHMLCGKLLKHCRTSDFTVKTTPFIHTVCQYLRSDNDLRLESVSRHFGYSAEHFSRKFHLELGIPYKQYCEKIRQKAILRALDDDGISLTQIAENLGYSDTSSFVRAFRRIHGITPGAYRRLKKQV